MKTRQNHRFAVLAIIVILSCIIVSMTAATTETNQLSLSDIVSRLLGLEKRVATVEERLEALEQKFEQQPPTLETMQKQVLEIVSPKNGDEIGMNVIVEGIVRVDDIGERSPVVAIHPLLTNLIWIQPRPLTVEKISDGYRFRCRAYCGTPKQGIGEQFEIYALLPEKDILKEGDQLEQLPKDVLISPSILVTRTRN